MPPRAPALLGVGIALALMGCQSTEPTGLEISWATEYERVDQVVDDSDLVVIGTAASQAPIASDEAGMELDATLTTFDVLEVERGTLEAPTVDVRSSDGLAQDEAAAFDVGTTYLVFLQDFEFEPGQGTGTFITVGQVAAYELPAGPYDATTTARRITTRGGLPNRASLAELLEPLG